MNSWVGKEDVAREIKLKWDLMGISSSVGAGPACGKFMLSRSLVKPRQTSKNGPVHWRAKAGFQVQYPNNHGGDTEKFRCSSAASCLGTFQSKLDIKGACCVSER